MKYYETYRMSFTVRVIWDLQEELSLFTLS